MNSETSNKNSQLIAALREAVGVVQMVLYKELRALLDRKNPHGDRHYLSNLAGALTNEVFGTQNPGARFVEFRDRHRGEIEQQLLALKDQLPEVCDDVTDALRIQTLCDHQEGLDSSQTLVRAKEFGFLAEDREVPLPSTFMMMARALGEKHHLIIAPTQTDPEQNTTTIH